MIHVLRGDCRTILPTLYAESVQCCVTSPPYFGLRDYGVSGQMGLEPTPDAFVAELVAVFREVRRVLRDDGTLWLNLGDSYAANRGYQVPDSKHVDVGNSKGMKADVLGLKPKDLIGIPWRVAFALQADGWYLRSDIIWHKPNPMPESVTDRPTKSHEYMFLLSKSERYYYDADAIREPLAPASVDRLSQPNLDNQKGSERVPGKTNGNMKAVARDPLGRDRRPSGWADSDDGAKTGRYKSGNKERKDASERGVPVAKKNNERERKGCPNTNGNVAGSVPWEDTGIGRNKRTVWTVTTQPFRDAHFATFPTALIEPCILAGAPKGGTVLDPFGGAGTTGLVADRLGRNAVLIELNPTYAQMAERRITNDNPLFADVRG